MHSFLYDTAKQIIERPLTSGEKCCFVFPNKRTAMFFRKYYGELTGKSSWMPDMFTIEAIIKRFTKTTVPDKLTLLFDMYAVAKDVLSNSQNNSDSEYSFDKFYFLGEILLNDLNEIDSYLVDIELLFKNIQNFEEIEASYNFFTDEQKEIIKNFWLSFSAENSSDEKRKFIDLWEKIPVIFQRFREKLSLTNYGYTGLLYRKMAEQIDNDTLPHQAFQKYIFIGFNALNKSEKKLFAFLQKMNKAEFFWDTDAYYQFDEKQEAGLFLRENFTLFSQQKYPVPANFAKAEKNITLIGVPLSVGQAKIIPTLLNNLGLADNTEEVCNNTAVVLADENLLFPVLHAIPTDVEKINITMGYPLKATSLYALLDGYLSMQRFLKISGSLKPEYYFKDVLNLLRHPSIWNKEKEKALSIIEVIEKENLVYVPITEVEKVNSPLLNLLFEPVSLTDKGSELLNRILNILFALYSGKSFENQNGNSPLENEYIYQVYTNVKRIREVLESKAIAANFDITMKLLIQILEGITIPFTADALNGLQVMGVMETRGLDFQNVIVLGANEGIFPSSGKAPSFITESFRNAFELPVLKQQDSIFAYLFYRILQRAKNITITYNNVTGNSVKGEISRFVLQILYESGLDIKHLQFKQDFVPSEKKDISIIKDEHVKKSLQRYLLYTKENLYDGVLRENKEFSASSLSSYMECKLRFYFQYVAEIRNIPSVEEEITPATLGNIIHHCIEEIYNEIIRPKQLKSVTAQDIDDFKTRIDEFINKAFAHQYKVDDGSFQFKGNQLIIREVVKKHIQNILQVDRRYAPFEISSLEGFAKSEITINVENRSETARLKGFIDRIDKKDNVFRIVDYKTGSVGKRFPSVEVLFTEAAVKSDYKAVFQTFFYGILAKTKFKNHAQSIYPVIYDVRAMYDDQFNPNLYRKQGRDEEMVNELNFNDFLNEYEVFLSQLISEIFDVQVPFNQTENTDNCEYCSFKQICGR